MTDDKTNGTPVREMLEDSALQRPPSALAALPPAVAAQINSLSKPALAEALAGHVLAQFGPRLQAEQAQAALARLAVAHLVARQHRGLVDGNGRAVDLGTTIALTSDASKLLPHETPLVHLTPIGGDGEPWKGPQAGPLVAIDVKVEAPAEQPKVTPAILGVDGKGDA